MYVLLLEVLNLFKRRHRKKSSGGRVIYSSLLGGSFVCLVAWSLGRLVATASRH